MGQLKNLALAAGLVAIVAPGFAAAQGKVAKGAAATPVKSAPASTMQGGVGEGDVQVGVSASFRSSDAVDLTLIGGNLGYYLRDNIILGADLFYIDTSSDAADSTGALLGLGGDYLFSAWKPQQLSNPLVPFVGASYTLGLEDFDDTDFLDLHAGLKQFIGERISVDYTLQHLMATDSDFDDADSNNFLVELNFYF